MIMARNEDGTYSQVGFVKDNVGNDTEYIYDKDGDIVFEKGFTRETSGTVPLTINGIGKDLKDWNITGNTVQDGTPTLDTPQEVKAVGDRTANLFDGKIVQGGLSDSNGQIVDMKTRIRTNKISVSENTKYTISSNLIVRSVITYKNEVFVRRAFDGSSSNNTISSFTVPVGANQIAISFKGNKAGNIDITPDNIEYLMINEGSTPLPYEPYGYKIPVVMRGKNLFDKTAVRYEVAIGGKVGSIVDAPGAAIFIIPAIKGIKNYTLKVKSDVVINIIRLAFYDKPIPVPGEYVNNVEQISNSKNPTVTSSNVNNLPYIVVQIGGAFVDSYGLDTVQLEIGDTATPYEPYHEPITIPIYLDSPLYKIGDYADRLSKTEEIRIVKELLLTGDEEFGYANSCFTYTFDDKPISVQPIKAEIFSNVYDGVKPKYRDQLINYQCCITRNFNQIAIRDNNYADAADFKAYLSAQYAAGTPIKIYYVIQTPKTKTVEPVEIPTLNDTTVIDVDTKIEPSDMYIKYKSSK